MNENTKEQEQQIRNFQGKTSKPLMFGGLVLSFIGVVLLLSEVIAISTFMYWYAACLGLIIAGVLNGLWGL